MAGRVHQVELVGLAVRRLPVEPHGLRLDGDPALLLDVHVVEHLRATSRASVSPPVALDQPVGERRLAVVDMGDDREIADPGEVGHSRAPLAEGCGKGEAPRRAIARFLPLVEESGALVERHCVRAGSAKVRSDRTHWSSNPCTPLVASSCSPALRCSPPAPPRRAPVAVAAAPEPRQSRSQPSPSRRRCPRWSSRSPSRTRASGSPTA